MDVQEREKELFADDLHAYEAISLVKKLERSKDRSKTTIDLCTEIGFMRQEVERLVNSLRKKESIINELEEKIRRWESIEHQDLSTQTINETRDFASQSDYENEDKCMQTTLFEIVDKYIQATVDTSDGSTEVEITHENSNTQTELCTADKSMQSETEMADKTTQNASLMVDNDTQIKIEVVDISVETECVQIDIEIVNNSTQTAANSVKMVDKSTQSAVDKKDNSTQCKLFSSQRRKHTDMEVATKAQKSQLQDMKIDVKLPSIYGNGELTAKGSQQNPEATTETVTIGKYHKDCIPRRKKIKTWIF